MGTGGSASGEPRTIPVRRRTGAVRWLRESPVAIILLAAATGLVTAYGALVFRWLIEVSTEFFAGYTEYPAQGRMPSEQWPELGIWFLVLAPVIAGAIYGPLVYWLAPEARRLGAKEASDPYAEHGRGVSLKTTAVKTVGSALTIGGGGSVGREGPMVAIGSAVGSALAGALRIDTSRVRLLVACGAAAGIAAAFNAPIAGAFFAMELIVRSYAARSFGAVVLASWTAHLVTKAAIGEEKLFALPHFDVPKLAELPVFLLVGVLAGVVGIVFSKAVPLVGRLCDRVWRGPEWLRPAVGGLVLGAGLLALPEMYGSGYPVLERAIGGQYELAMLLVLMIGKIVATSFTLGIGGLGGVFAPTLFIGAMAGTAFGVVVNDVVSAASSPAVYGLVGMAAAFAGAERAPLTAIVLLFELTGELTLVLPLVLAVATAAAAVHLLEKRSRPAESGLAITAATVAREVPEPIPAGSTLAEAAAALAGSPFALLPVVDEHGQYVGCVSAHDVVEACESGAATIGGLITHPSTLSPDAELREMLDTLSFQGGAPVLGDEGELVGWVVYEDLLKASYPA